MSDNMGMDFEGGLGHAFWRDEAKRLEAENTELRREISGLRDPGGKKFAALMGKPDDHTEESDRDQTTELGELKASVDRLIAVCLQKDALITEMDRIGSKALECINQIRSETVSGTPYSIQLLADEFLANQSAPTCCTPSAEDLASLAAGDYCAEELWGGPRPTCPKCIDYWNQVDRGHQSEADRLKTASTQLTKARELIQQNCRPIIAAECERTSYGNANARSVLEIIDKFIGMGADREG